MSRILLHQNGQEMQLIAAEGENLLELLRRSGAALSAPCGGNGKCGKCLVELCREDGTAHAVLACRTTVTEDCTVSLDGMSGGLICVGEGAGTIAATGREGYGAAVDIGSTTVALRLLDLNDGSEKGIKSAWNAQAAYGADVISRIQYTMENETGLERLNRTIREQIAGLLWALCREAGIDRADVRELYVTGNTVMQHIFAGLSPAGIAVAPFKPESLFTGEEAYTFEGIRTLCAPCIAGYVGGDIVCGLLASGLSQAHGKALFLDIGTNGEMALGGEEGFVCCAVASGPAFEGAGIRCGMASTAGAINHVRWGESGLELEVIGGGIPRGICGSGLLDLIAVLLEKEIVDGSGRLLGPEDAPEGFEEWLEEDENGNGLFWLNREGGVCLTAKDVRQLQLAKAAVAAGIEVLMEETGTAPEEISGLYLAGGFGSSLNAASAAAIGMIPRALQDKVVCLGNTALQGAQMALLNEESRDMLLKIQKKCRYLELSGNEAFSRAFPERMMFYDEE